jgi:hypothetical protein
MIKKVILAVMSVTVAATGFPGSAYAQEKIEEVTLTVSGDGATKQDATAAALRSAVEQAFGVFVSANTTILDDELVKDEIATVASGNIKQYEEIASIQLPNGNTAVTLKAVVSVSKLITYAQSKGSTAEFAGATFAMNMKLKELNTANEEKAIENMLKQLEALAPAMYDYELTLGEPKLVKSYDYRRDTSFYQMDAIIDVIYNDNTTIWNEILIKTLTSLSMTDIEREEYKKVELDVYGLRLSGSYWSTYDSKGFYSKDTKPRIDKVNIDYCFRSGNTIKKMEHVADMVMKAAFNFKITDNLGGISMINIKHWTESPTFTGHIDLTVFGDGHTIFELEQAAYFEKSYKNAALSLIHLYKERPPVNYSFISHKLGIQIRIPKDDISKYSNFTISNKNQ